MSESAYTPEYRNSWALLIGIDDYQADLPPLNTAAKGVRALADTLQTELGFKPEHIIVLENEAATQRAIRRAFTAPLSRANKVGPDDRVVIYFGGHGLTFDTAEGEVGCIAPHDIEPGFIDTAIPMDELTRLANRIHAKHVLFLLDACFSGFATTREASAGVERQVQDFLLRPARQVITAGTREQTVSDYWGPGGHSLFTGFLLEGLRGAAPAPGGVLRAFHLAGYLQDQVAQHSRSLQTPQYAALLGSQGGDFIFSVRDVSDLPDWLLALAHSADTTQRVFAVGQLYKLAEAEESRAQSAQALVHLQRMVESDADEMVRTSARSALRELLPVTTIVPVTRDKLFSTSAGLEVDEPEEGAEEAELAVTLLVTEGPASGQRLTVGAEPVTIGRTADNTLTFADAMTSRRHARIERQADGLWVTDLGSTNGTFVNGKRVEQPRRLEEGDRVLVGGSLLVVSFAPPDDAPVAGGEEPADRAIEEAEEPAGEWQEVEQADAPPGAGSDARTAFDKNKRFLIPAAIALALCLMALCLLVLLSY